MKNNEWYMMCNLYSVVYFWLFIVSIVKSSELKDEPLIEETVKVIKHHHKVMPAIKNSEVALKINDNDYIQTNTRVHGTSNNINEEENEDFSNYEKTDHGEDLSRENIAENSDLLADDDITKTMFVGSLTRRLNIDDTDDNDDTNVDNIETHAESGEILIYNPNSKSLSQDVVLDLKARTGNVKSEEKDLKDSSGDDTPRIRHFQSLKTNMRSSYALSDYFDDVSKPFDYQAFDVNPYKWPNSAYRNDPLLQRYGTNYARPEILDNHISNYIPMLPPLYFKNINSKEVIYPNPNGRENMWEQGSSPQPFKTTVTSPYLGYNYPNSQVNSPRTLQRCSTCQSGMVLSDHHFIRSVGADSNTFQTANGRSIDFNPIDSNSYPLIPVEDIDSEEVLRMQEALSQEVFGAPFHDFIDPQGVVTPVPATDKVFHDQSTDYPRNHNINFLSNLIRPHLQGYPVVLNRKFTSGLQRYIG